MQAVSPAYHSDIQKFLDEVREYFLRAAQDMRTYTIFEIQAAIIKIAEYLLALADALMRTISTSHHVYRQKNDEVASQEISSDLLKTADENDD
jgi:hypothetical protein